jgi:hypothetical protein
MITINQVVHSYQSAFHTVYEFSWNQGHWWITYYSHSFHHPLRTTFHRFPLLKHLWSSYPLNLDYHHVCYWWRRKVRLDLRWECSHFTLLWVLSWLAQWAEWRAMWTYWLVWDNMVSLVWRILGEWLLTLYLPISLFI